MALTDRRRRLDELLKRALALPDDSLDEFVAVECADDPSLGAELYQLISMDTMTVSPGSLPRRRRMPHPAMPAQIGPYRIVRVVSAGGMGTVFEAIQQRPHRVVAVKTVRPDFVSEDLSLIHI